MKKAVALVVAALTLAAVAVAILALVGAFNATKPKEPTSFAFDSAYEVKRAEGEVTERVLEKVRTRPRK